VTPRRLGTLVALVSLLISATALSRPVRVRGGAKLQAQAKFTGPDRQILELRGRLIDDARDPIEDAWIDVTSAGGLDLTKDYGLCRRPQVSIAPNSSASPGTALRIATSVGGEICLRWQNSPATGTIQLRFSGDGYHGSADLETRFDRAAAQKLATTLRFEPRPLLVDLDKDHMAVTGVLALALSTAHAARDGHTVTLHDERGTKVASGVTGGDGKVRLDVASTRLGPPGAGALELRFAGTPQLHEATDEQPISRRASVTMKAPSAVAPADPGDTTEISLELQTTRGPVDGGVVEALVADASIASAQVTDGRAVVAVPVPPKVAETMTVTLRYLPSAPFYTAGPPLSVQVPIAPPSMLLRALLAILVGAAAAWVVISWRRSKERPSPSKGRPMLTPGVHVVHSRRGTNDWKGTVVDAHDGQVLAQVRITVRAPGFDDDVLLTTTTDSRGIFAFDLDQRPDGAELIASSDSHSEERKALPAGGTLKIALITRRRALLRRLVQWARLRGQPYDHKPDPTPGHVVATGKRQGREEIESWAQQVEGAAFGPGEVDENVEAAVRKIEPGPR